MRLYVAIVFCLVFVACAGTNSAGSESAARDNQPIVITPVKSGASVNFRGISMLDQATVWLGGAEGTVLRTQDGGVSWESFSVPDSDTLDFRDVYAGDERKIVLMSAGPGSASRIYQTVNGGETWTTAKTNGYSKAFYNAIDFWDYLHGVMISDPIDDKPYVMRTKNGGLYWERLGEITLPKMMEGEYGFAASGTCIKTVAPSSIYVVTGGSHARVFLSRDFGFSWNVVDTPMASGTPSSGIFSIAFRDPQNGVAVGGDYENPEMDEGTIIVTRNGGVTWTRVASGMGFGHKSCVLHLVGEASLALGRTGGIYSPDKGEPWHTVTTDP
ncbi:MAG: hypothetical protein HKN21_16385, partial [Candidatus Eisenbacteria bacterium]|nr:hypothetical protein [Candidatus Eisenbacteria bacterium]